jgi:hypothetical protein
MEGAGDDPIHILQVSVFACANSLARKLPSLSAEMVVILS